MFNYTIMGAMALFLAACATAQRQDTQSTYSNNVAKLGLTPVYPPREDIQVGDIYLLSTTKPPVADENQTVQDIIANSRFDDTVSIYIGSNAALLHKSESYLKSRVVFQKTNAYRETSTAKKHQPDQYEQDSNTFQTRANREITSLPIVAFPEITLNAGFSNSIGIVRALHAIGLGSAANTKVTLDFNDVRAYGVPKNTVFVDAQKYGSDAYKKLTVASDDIEEQISAKIRTQIFRISRNNPAKARTIETDISKRCYTVSVITKVYLTRKITYNYSNARIISAAIKRVKDGTENKTATVNNPTIISIKLPAATTGNNDLEIDTATQTAINDNVVNAISGAAQGDGLSFQGWDALGMRFSRDFERPVVIAYEAVTRNPANRPGEGRSPTAAENKRYIFLQDIKKENKTPKQQTEFNKLNAQFGPAVNACGKGS